MTDPGRITTTYQHQEHFHLLVRLVHISSAWAQSKRPSGSVVSAKRSPRRALSGKRFHLRILSTRPRESTPASSEKDESDATSASADACVAKAGGAHTAARHGARRGIRLRAEGWCGLSAGGAGRAPPAGPRARAATTLATRTDAMCRIELSASACACVRTSHERAAPPPPSAGAASPVSRASCSSRSAVPGGGDQARLRGRLQLEVGWGCGARSGVGRRPGATRGCWLRLRVEGVRFEAPSAACRRSRTRRRTWRPRAAGAAAPWRRPSRRRPVAAR